MAIVTEKVKELIDQATVLHYEWLYSQQPWSSWTRIVVRDEEYKRQWAEQREARQEIKALRVAR